MSEPPADTVRDHRRAWEAIPWLVNGSASAAQRRLLDAHLPHCEDCRAELVRQRELQAAIASEPLPAVADVDSGLDRLFARIDEAQDDDPAALAAPSRRPDARRAGVSSLTLWLAAAVVVEALALALLGAGLATRADYATLSDAPAARGATIRIVPAPGLRMEELQRMLQPLQLQVVAGPNGSGALDLAPRAASDTPAREPQIAALRAEAGLRLVEPIDPPRAPR